MTTNNAINAGTTFSNLRGTKSDEVKDDKGLSSAAVSGSATLQKMSGLVHRRNEKRSSCSSSARNTKTFHVEVDPTLKLEDDDEEEDMLFAFLEKQEQVLLYISGMLHKDLWSDDFIDVQGALTQLNEMCHGCSDQKQANRRFICDLGGPHVLLKACLDRFTVTSDGGSNADAVGDVQSAACGVLQTLVLGDEEARRMVLQSDGVSVVVRAMARRPRNAHIQLWECSLLRAVLVKGEVQPPSTNTMRRRRVTADDAHVVGAVVRAVVRAMNEHRDKAVVLMVACSTLATLAATGGKDGACAVFHANGLAAIAGAVAVADRERKADEHHAAAVQARLVRETATETLRIVSEHIIGGSGVGSNKCNNY